MNDRPFVFEETLQFSQGIRKGADVRDILLCQIPGAVSVRQANMADDRSGTDWWVSLSNGQDISVDLKARREDWAAHAVNPKDDLALETYSVIESDIPGWTRDPFKRTDYILWHWEDTGRWCLIPFRMLCRIFELNWQEWRRQFPTYRQRTIWRSGRGCYHSECVFVPRREVWRELYRHFSGSPKSPTPRPTDEPARTMSGRYPA